MNDNPPAPNASDTTARARLALSAARLRPHIELTALAIHSTADVPPLDTLMGQDDALASLEFGVEVDAPGYSLYVAGAEGSGRMTAVRAHLERAAQARTPPRDWVYVHNFGAPERPLALELPPGRAAPFARAMDAFVRDARLAIRRAFESDEHDRRRRAALEDTARRRRGVFDEMGAIAHAHGFRVDLAPDRCTSTPLVDGEPVTDERYETLSPEARADLARRTEQFEAQVSAAVRTLRQLERDDDQRRREVDRADAGAAVEPLLADLRARHADVPDVLTHLDAVAEDVVDHAEQFAPPDALEPDASTDDEDDDDNGASAPADVRSGPSTVRAPAARGTGFERYRVNVLIDHGSTPGAPVVVETRPTPENLAGWVDYRVTAGGLVADFLRVRAGALHRANGGFLVLRAADVLQTESAWATLKRALLDGEIRLDPANAAGVLPSTALRPMAIPLALKVVLVGTEALYQLLYELDADFRELFKVKVEFAPDVPCSPDTLRQYAAFLARCERDRSIRPFDASGIARVAEHGARLCGDQGRLSARMGEIADLAIEASHWAGKAERAVVSGDDVERAIRARHARSGLLERRTRADLASRVLLVETTGRTVGQVNGLVVLDAAGSHFALPARITATVGPGRGTLCSIERDVELSGPIHDKGVLTLRGYLTRTYGRAGPLAMAATLAFEQSYGALEGDSASLAELLALLSALADVPLDQGIAVTGSVDQRGQLQPVGDVSCKVEAYFEACAAAGLTGAQGVLVPAANAAHLVLDRALVAAVEAGRFHVWAARSVDDAIELLTDQRAGAAGDDGTYPPESVHGRAAAALRRFAAQLAQWPAGGAGSVGGAGAVR